jgi:hypothetical protein
MAITTANYETGVFSNREYEKQQTQIKNAPKVFRFTWFADNEAYKTNIEAPDESKAQLLFDLLAKESGLPVRVEGQEYIGIVDFQTPDLKKRHKKKISVPVYDAYYKILRETAIAEENRVQAEQDSRKAENAKTREAKINHALDILAQAAAYARKIGLAKAQREQEQDADFSRWMKIKDGNNNQ